MPAPYLRRIWLEPSRIADRAAYPFCLPFLGDEFELSSTDRSPSSSVKMAAANPLCSRGSRCSPATTMPVAARATGLSTIPRRPRPWAVNFRRPCARAGSPKSPMAGSSAPRPSFRRQVSRRGWEHVGFPLLFARRGFSALLRRAVPAAGHLHLRRAGIRVVALPPDGIFEANAPDGAVHDLSDRHGHAFPDADGLSQCTAAAIIEIRPGAGDRRTDRSLQGHARILRRSDGVRGSGDRLIVALPPRFRLPSAFGAWVVHVPDFGGSASALDPPSLPEFPFCADRLRLSNVSGTSRSANPAMNPQTMDLA